jgi:hypothetical protein
MAEITSNLRTLLLTDSEISSAFGTRIYVVRVPDSPSYPFAIIYKISPSPNYSHDGRWGNIDLVQIDVYDNSDSPSGCVVAAELIETRLDGYTGSIGNIDNALAMVRQSSVEEWVPDARHWRSRMDVDIKWTV